MAEADAFSRRTSADGFPVIRGQRPAVPPAAEARRDSTGCRGSHLRFPPVRPAAHPEPPASPRKQRDVQGEAGHRHVFSRGARGSHAEPVVLAPTSCIPQVTRLATSASARSAVRYARRSPRRRNDAGNVGLERLKCRGDGHEYPCFAAALNPLSWRGFSCPPIQCQHGLGSCE